MTFAATLYIPEFYSFSRPRHLEKPEVPRSNGFRAVVEPNAVGGWTEIGGKWDAPVRGLPIHYERNESWGEIESCPQG